MGLRRYRVVGDKQCHVRRRLHIVQGLFGRLVRQGVGPNTLTRVKDMLLSIPRPILFEHTLRAFWL